MDELVSVWIRTYLTIEAESESEAVKIALDNNDSNITDSQILYETEYLMDPKDNDGQATVEIFDSSMNNLIYSNKWSEE